ncbi:MAG: IS66 family transposase [Chloroflexi bacterium]|nr:IS66 family transposase [Chloroflexota bacterium]
MSDDELRQLSPEQVVAHVRRLEDALHRRDRDLAEAQARIAELEAKLARRGEPPKTPQNSSTPPSKGWKRDRPAGEGAKRGPPFGHLGTSRRRAAPDWVVLCQPTHCAACGADLAFAPQERVGTSQVVELPPAQPVVLEARRYAVTCLQCGATTAAAYPAGFEPTRVFGPHLEALWTYLHEQHHVSYARLAAFGRDLWHLGISQGALANALRRAARRLQPQAAVIREQVRASPTIGSDETSARVNGRTHWQWVFQTPTASYHVIVPRRNGEVVQEFLGDAEPQTWVSDLWKPQLNAPAARHQICLAHQLRELQYVVDQEQSAWAQDCQALFRRAIYRAHQREQGELWGAAYTAAVRKIEADCDRLLATPVAGAEASRLWVRFRAHRDHLFVFLYDPAVPPTNNTSEQALRNSVVHRKVTGGFRSDWGADAHAIATTVLDTARKRGENLLTTLQAALGQPVAIPPGLPILSPSR